MVLSEENNKEIYQDSIALKILELEQKVATLTDENRILSEKQSKVKDENKIQSDNSKNSNKYDIDHSAILVEEHEHFVSLIETMQEMIYSTDMNLNLVSFNKTFAQTAAAFTGQSPEKGANLFDHFPMVDRDFLNKVTRPALNGECVFLVEKLTKDEKDFYFEVSSNPIINLNQEQIGISVMSKDVTERVEMQKRLDENRKLVIQSQKVAKLGFLYLSIEDRNWKSSDELDKIFGIDENYIRTFENLISIIAPEFRFKIINAYNESIVSNLPFEIQCKIIRDIDKTERWISISGELDSGLKENSNRIIAAVKDITDQKKTQETYELLYKISRSIHTYPKIEDAFTYSLESICRFLDFSYGEIWSKNIDDSSIVFRANWGQNEKVTSFRTPDSRRVLFKGKGLAGTAWGKKEMVYFNELSKSPLINQSMALNAGIVSGLALPILYKDEVVAVLSLFSENRITDAQISSEFLKNIGSQIGIDIEKRKSDSALSNFFNLSPNFMVIAGLDGYFKKINPAVSRLLKYSEEELLSKPYIEFVHPDDKDNTAVKGSELHNGASVFNFENRYITKDGEIIWLWWSATSKDEENLIYAVGKDVTESIEDKVKLENQNKELTKTNAELDRFVYSTSHDLRSPITSIVGLLQFIEDESKETETLLHAGMIKSRIKRLDSFIQNILNYSRNNRIEISVSKINFTEIINSILNSTKSIPEARKIRFEVHVDEKINFFSDANRINTIFENIIDNAIKFHRYNQENPFVRIKVTCSEKESIIEIEDNGIGIDENYREKIFDMFFRINGKISGAGLGLYIVKEIIEKIEGSITVNSNLNEGTNFKIKLKNLHV